MKKGQTINGYLILRDFTTAGGGLSKWTFAKKGAEEFFLKEFLAPTYPTDDSPGSAKTKEAKRKRCIEFESHQKSIIDSLKGKCAPGGNVVFARAFFREGAKYYKVTDKVDVASLSIEDIARLPLDNRVLIMKTVAHSLGVLHKCDIVHGDLKPNNLLIKRSSHSGDTYIAKLIDFDSSYFSGRPPVAEDLVGDLVFYSPESAQYMREDSSVEPNDLTLSCDIFALGVIYCLYLTGQLPSFNQAKFQYPCTAAINGEKVCIRPEGLPSRLAEIVNDMLQTEAGARPTISQVFERLKTLDKALPLTVSSDDSSSSSLRGSLLKRTSSPPPMHPSPEATKETPTSSSKLSSKPSSSKLRGKLLKRDEI